MRKHEAGLHKDVATIFNSVWNPKIDNHQNNIRYAYKDLGASELPKPLSTEFWPEKVKQVQKTKHTSSTWSFFSPKARREKKRLSAISRHLLINLPD